MIDIKFSDLVGKIIEQININGRNDEIEIICKTGERYKMYHSQDCCESVVIDDICGNIADILNSPVLTAEERTSDTAPDSHTPEYEPESQTWTFYELATNRGSVTIRWFGSSNGYYSESVDFVRAA